MKTKNIPPFEPTHPGTTLLDELIARNISQKEFAEEIGVLPTYLNEIVKGKRSVTADFSLLLEKSLGIEAEYWLRFQAQYDIDKARIKAKNINKLLRVKTRVASAKKRKTIV
jgi:addiction module HigA family antidote